jgi:hypothetical protein
MYLSQDFNNRPEYNDVPVLIDEKVYDRLRENSKFNHGAPLLVIFLFQRN